MSLRPEQLALAEKLLLVEDIRDSIANAGEELPRPQWHKQQLDAHYQKCRRAKEPLQDWQSVHEKLHNPEK